MTTWILVHQWQILQEVLDEALLRGLGWAFLIPTMPCLPAFSATLLSSLTSEPKAPLSIRFITKYDCEMSQVPVSSGCSNQGNCPVSSLGH